MAITPLEIAEKINQAPPGGQVEAAERYLEEYEGEDKDEVAGWLLEMAVLGDSLADA